MKLTKKMMIVLRAIHHLRVKNQTHALSSGDVMKLTATWNGGKEISKNNWNPAHATNATWREIGNAINGLLSFEHPIERVIRSFRSKAASSEEMLALEKEVENLTNALKDARRAKNNAVTELSDFKTRTYRDQCEDAHYRINFEKTLALNKRLAEAADIDKKTMEALRADIANLNNQLKLFGEAGTDETPGQKIKKMKPPVIFEPRLLGSNSENTEVELLEQYIAKIDSELEKLKKVALKEHLVEIAVVFHRFNISSPTFYENEIPFRSAIPHRYVLTCFAPIPATRRKIYEKIAPLSTFPPKVILVVGDSKVVSLPAEKRTSESDHEWFVYQATKPRSGIRYQKPDVISEGYHTTIISRSADE